MLQKQTEILQYRHEYKYIIDSYQFELLRFRLSEMMDIDPHTGDEGKYSVRSLYFDDYNNQYYYDNENGIEPREKYRIRIYNGSDQHIVFELKQKEADKIGKTFCHISREQVDRLIMGENIIWTEDMSPLMKKFFILRETKLLRPKIIVDYERIPYVCQNGNVRVTMDYNITTSPMIDRFFDNSVYYRPVLPMETKLLEVKYDQYLPDYIFHTIQSNRLVRTTFSKYYLCRKMGGLR